MLRKLVFALTVALALILPSAAVHPTTVSAHTGYESVYPSSIGAQTYYADFYVSAGTWHYIQQTYPDSRQCYHRLIHRSTGTVVAAAWLWGNGHGSGDTMGVFNGGSTSQAFRHSVTGCAGQVQVYNFHG